jgi:cysteine-rich repeat protein
MTRVVLLLAALLAACGVTIPGAGTTDTTGPPDITVSTGETGSSGQDTGTDATASPGSTSSATSSTTAGAGDASDDTGSDSSSSSSGAPGPFCGDGLIDPGESCDDMNDNPDDGCKLCTRDRIVFSSSVEYLGWELEGLYGADQRCRMLAAVAMLPRFETYRAWLSDSTTAAADRITHSKGRYILVNGLVVAADWDALISGTLENPINVTESSEVSVGSRVWTGTLANGQPAYGSSFCGNWTEKDAFALAGSGIRNWTDASWTFFEQNACGSPSSIYCFEN